MDVTFAPASVDDAFLRRFEDSFLGGIEPVLEGVGLSRDELVETMRETGDVLAVVVDGEEAGSLWLELRERTLHLHALLLDEVWRGRGVGRAVLDLLDEQFAGLADELELGVQEGSEPAERLYEGTGFREVSAQPELGFRVLRRPVPD